MVKKEDILALCNKLNFVNVQAYLNTTGWLKRASNQDHIAIFYKELNEKYYERLLPLNRDFKDYSESLHGIIKAISEIENKEEEQVISDLLIESPSDVLRFRVSNKDTEEGTISFEAGFELFEATKQALYAAACDIIQPEIYHGKLSFKSADQFIEKCRLGQTSRGSFIASVICPLMNDAPAADIAKQLSFFEDKATYETSFTRKVTRQIMGSLQMINSIIERDEKEKVIEGKGEFVVSANFLESILKMNNLNSEDGGLEIMSTWSAFAPVPQATASKIKIEKDYLPVLDYMIEKMTPKDNIVTGEFVGRVYQVRAEPDAQRRKQGEVTLNLLGSDGGSFSAKVILDAETYILACKAHEAGKNILVKGNLISGRRTKIIENPVFSVLGDPS